jgi:CRP/FNR family transcriptional regulator, cyclic AMP receptor protein
MISREVAAEMLSRTALFGLMEADHRRAVVQEMREMVFEASQAIFARGDEGRDLYFVMTGRVRLSVLTPEGRELSFAHAEAGQIFGEIAVLDGGARTADATAVTKVQALALPKTSLLKLMETRPKIGEGIVKFLCNRVREADQQLEGIALYPIEARLARFFLAAARQKPASKTSTKVVLDLPISQSELALLIGASRPKVNAALALLEGNKAIVKSDGQITCDLDELEAMAGT